uniref:Uncharacterized protein n=1 Tax=Molossus molossus TaxID=27622 RepID=A0A7J8EER1_MOLMO|nr:hypothetical protein HJG59_008942 [Molossus molossus]
MPIPGPKVQGQSPEEIAKNEVHQVQNKGQNDQNSPRSSGGLPLTPGPPVTKGVLTSPKCSPGPLDLSPKHPHDSLCGNTQLSPRCSSSQGQVATNSCSPAGDGQPPLPPDSAAALLSDPTPCCSLLPDRSTKEGLGEGPPPTFPGPLTLYKERDAEKPARTNPPLACASRKSCQRTKSTPLLLPLSPLRQDPDDLPPPPKRPCLAGDRRLGTDAECQTKRTLEDKTQVMAGCSATQSAPSFSPPGSAIADTPPLDTQTGQVRAPITARVSADLTSRPTVDDYDESEMDTTPPCYAATIITYPESSTRFLPVYQIQYSVEHRRPAGPPPAHLH